MLKSVFRAVLVWFVCHVWLEIVSRVFSLSCLKMYNSLIGYVVVPQDRFCSLSIFGFNETSTFVLCSGSFSCV